MRSARLKVRPVEGEQSRDVGNEQAGGVLTGTRVLAGLNTTLLKNVRGGQGIAASGSIQLTDRSGATATVCAGAASSAGSSAT